MMRYMQAVENGRRVRQGVRQQHQLAVGATLNALVIGVIAVVPT